MCGKGHIPRSPIWGKASGAPCEMASKRSQAYQFFARSVYKGVRQAAKIPYIITPKKVVAIQKGGFFNKLEGDLGQEEYQELCAVTADVMLVRIIYGQTELDDLSKSLDKSRRLLNSNFDNTKVRPAATVAAIYVQRSCMHVLVLRIFL